MDCMVCGGELKQEGNKHICSGCGYSPNPNESDINLRISPQELKSKIDKGEKIFLLDVRQPDEHNYAKITGSFLLPLNELPSKFESLSRERPIVAYCHHGVRSLTATRFLVQKGFKNVKSLEGGIHLWSNVVDRSIPTY